MLKISEIKINASDEAVSIGAAAEKRLRLPKGSLKSFFVIKESVDAREKPAVYRVYTIAAEFSIAEKSVKQAAKKAHVKCEEYVPEKEIEFPELCGIFSKKNTLRPVVAGFGPCGIFCALALANMGLRPIVLERGGCMEERVAAVNSFFDGGKLNLTTNVQFGEGGAGTFSDGKLTTGTKSPYQRFVLESFVKAGADPEILYKQKPHIGTDVLRTVVVNIRKEIESLGGEVRFNTRLDNILLKDGQLCAAVTDGGERIETNNLVLALGHSARDSFRMLKDLGFPMEQKQFSMGVRIEHPQSLIDKAQYGDDASSYGLTPADYKLNVKTKDGRGVYTFCMCPGGEVINASSHEGCVCTNGMSNFNRDSGLANSALLADVRPQDYSFGSCDPLAGVYFQEKYEHLAFLAGGGNYALPKEHLGEFIKNDSLIKTCLPDFVYSSLCEAVPILGKKLKGFDNPGAIVYGIESRSSSPVRVKRDGESLCSLSAAGVYPGGEGAGYAGGIMSAACDGVRIAFKIAEKICITTL